jgi:uncharacterized Tic20 family protein
MIMGFAEEIEKLDALKSKGAISAEEYQKAKDLLFQKMQGGEQEPARPAGGASFDANQWSMFVHLSQFLGYFTFLAGLVVPIILWQMKKNESDYVDRHGKVVVNWILSELIYLVVCIPLCFVLVGFVFLGILAVLSIVFTIIGALKANSGEIWPYPLSIQFFRVGAMGGAIAPPAGGSEPPQQGPSLPTPEPPQRGPSLPTGD